MRTNGAVSLIQVLGKGQPGSGSLQGYPPVSLLLNVWGWGAASGAWQGLSAPPRSLLIPVRSSMGYSMRGLLTGFV